MDNIKNKVFYVKVFNAKFNRLINFLSQYYIDDISVQSKIDFFREIMKGGLESRVMINNFISFVLEKTDICRNIKLENINYFLEEKFDDEKIEEFRPLIDKTKIEDMKKIIHDVNELRIIAKKFDLAYE